VVLDLTGSLQTQLRGEVVNFVTRVSSIHSGFIGRRIVKYPSGNVGVMVQNKVVPFYGPRCIYCVMCNNGNTNSEDNVYGAFITAPSLREIIRFI